MSKKPSFLQTSQGIPVEPVTHQSSLSESIQKTSPNLGVPMHHDSGSDRSDILLSPTKNGECYPVDNATVADKDAIIRHISKYYSGSGYKGFEDTESAKNVMEMMAIRMPPELQRAIFKIIQQTSSHEVLDRFVTLLVIFWFLLN